MSEAFSERKMRVFTATGVAEKTLYRCPRTFYRTVDRIISGETMIEIKKGGLVRLSSAKAPLSCFGLSLEPDRERCCPRRQ